MKALKQEYKPENISQDLYNLWMVEFFYGNENFDPAIFNEWWYARAKSQALEELLVAEIPSPQRRFGEVRRAQGLLPHQKPDYGSSIGTYGGLHYGTDFAYHREPKPAPRGRETGFAANFILLLTIGRELGYLDRRFRAGGKSFGNWAFKDFFASAHAILEEAEERKDMVTMLTGPRSWEHDYDHFWNEGMYEKRNNKKFDFYYYGREGLPVTIGRKSDEGKWVDANGRASPSGGQDVGEIIPMQKIFSPLRQEEYTPSLLRYDPSAVLWNASMDTNSFEGQLRHLQNGYWYNSGQQVGVPEFVNSVDYAAMKRFLTKMPNLGQSPYNSVGNTAVEASVIWNFLRNYWGKLSKTERSTVIWIGSSWYPGATYMCWKIIEDLSTRADVWFFDLHEQDREDYFFGEQAIRNKATRIINGEETDIPLLKKGSQRLFNYVHIDKPEELTKAVLKALKKR